MRFESIKMINYRQFKNVELDFKKTTKFDLHVIVGKSGTCKTNILNAINWCLYGDEPHFSKESENLPILNLSTIDNTEEGKPQTVGVSLCISSEEGSTINVSRTVKYRVYKTQLKQIPESSDFEIEITDGAGNTKFLQGDEAEGTVERFVPKRLREYFFFDGERLDHYFRETTPQNIKNAVFNISQVDLLERIEGRLESLMKDYRKEAGKNNPDIESKRQELDKHEDSFRTTRKQMEEMEKQVAIAKEKTREYEDKLRRVPNIESLQAKRESLKIARSEKRNKLDEKIVEKNELLFEYGRYLNLFPSIQGALHLIQMKIDNNEIPPNIDRDVLEKIRDAKYCSVCQRKLDEEGIKAIEDLLTKVKMSSELAKVLLSMQGPLSHLRSECLGFEKALRKLANDIGVYEKDLAEIEKRINEIDKGLSGYNIEDIREWHNERVKWEQIRDREQQRLGIAKMVLVRLQDRIKALKTELQEELKKEAKFASLRQQIDFLEKSLSIMKGTKEKIMIEVKNKMEATTKDIFFRLIWKKDTFRDVLIDPEYNLKVLHVSGYECLGSMGATEREFLALSFTIGLHEISGFDSPILIDTPVARVDNESRERFSKMFLDVSSHKQTILLFNQSEYSEEVRSFLDCDSSTRYVSSLSKDEKVTTMEVF